MNGKFKTLQKIHKWENAHMNKSYSTTLVYLLKKTSSALVLDVTADASSKPVKRQSSKPWPVGKRKGMTYANIWFVNLF